jgi:hypothetical protein
MKRLGFLVCSFIACAAVEGTAAAQQVPEATFTTATAKGVIGGALLGAESVMLVEAIAGTKPAWAYAVGGGLGAIGGGIGGYFAEQEGDPRISLYLLVAGMALALPTTVAVLSAAAYEPVNYTEDRPPADEPVADPARTTPATEKPTTRRPVPASKAPKIASGRALPPALFGWNQGELKLSIPAVEVRQMYTRTEVALYGVKQGHEVEVPVVNVVF